MPGMRRLVHAPNPGPFPSYRRAPPTLRDWQPARLQQDIALLARQQRAVVLENLGRGWQRRAGCYSLLFPGKLHPSGQASARLSGTGLKPLRHHLHAVVDPQAGRHRGGQHVAPVRRPLQ